MANNKLNPWTREQEQEMERLYDSGLGWPEIVQRVGHPKNSCQTRLSDIQRQRRIAAGEYEPRRPKEFMQPPPAPIPLPPSPFSARTQRQATLQADAELRARISVLGITAGLFGDPLPGRSALDRRSADHTDQQRQPYLATGPSR